MARTKGSKNRVTQRRERKIKAHADAIRDMIGEKHYFEGDAHAFLMYLYKDRRRDIEIRMEAAKAAISYEKPKLAAIAVGTTDGELLQQSITLQFVDAQHNPDDPMTIEHIPESVEKRIKFVS